MKFKMSTSAELNPYFYLSTLLILWGAELLSRKNMSEQKSRNGSIFSFFIVPYLFNFVLLSYTLSVLLEKNQWSRVKLMK